MADTDADSGILRTAPENSEDWTDEVWGAWCRAADRVHTARPSVPDLLARVAELESTLAERDEQIAYLLAAEPTLDDDQPGAPE